MKKIYIKGIPEPVSNIGFGTATTTLEDEEKVHAMLDHYVAAGGNFIDTARFYGRGSGIQHTEEVLGRWLEKGDNRSKVIIQSKCSNPYMDRNLQMFEEMPRVGRTFMYDDILFSRDKLMVDTIDLYLTHRDNPKVPVEEIVDTFEEFLRRGWIKAYGMSNWTLERFAEAYDYAERMGYQGPSVISPFFSLVKLTQPWYYRIPAFKDEWLEWFENHQDVTIAAWAAQGRGFFEEFPQYDPEQADPITRMAVLTEENFARKERVKTFSAETGIGTSQVSLLYVLSQKAQTLAITGPRTEKDIDDIVSVTERTLTQQEIDYLTLKADSYK